MTGLGPRVLIVAFDGWNDAGEAASSALAHLRSTQDYTAVFTVDPELYFDYQYTRPQLQADETGTPVLVWPEATIWRPEPAADGLWLLGGVEPARAWKAFVAEIVDAALREDVTGMVLLGSMMSDVPHTRPITVFRSSDNAPLRRALELERPSYEGPVGTLTVLAEAA